MYISIYLTYLIIIITISKLTNSSAFTAKRSTKRTVCQPSLRTSHVKGLRSPLAMAEQCVAVNVAPLTPRLPLCSAPAWPLFNAIRCPV